MEKLDQFITKDRIVAILREEILNGNLKPLQKLHEMELCEQLGVSRTPLREAIRILEAEGMVESVPNKGSRVAMFTVEDVVNIYELRILLEGLAIEKSVENLSAAKITELEEIQQKLRVAVSDKEWHEVDRLNQLFHLTAISSCPNDRMVATVKQLNQIGRLIRVSAFSVPGRSLKVLEEHDKILAAIKSGDAATTGRLIQEHLTAARDVVLQRFK